MRVKSAIIVLLILIISLNLLFINFQNINAENLIVSVYTNKTSYNPGENVVITIRVNKIVGGDMFVGVDGANVFVNIEPPGGGVAAFPAVPTAIVGEYQYVYNLSPSAGGGVYEIGAQATHPGDTPGSDQTTFTVTGPPALKTVDWRVENPTISPPNPTTADPAILYVWLRFATVAPGPYPVNIICTVDGMLVGGGTMTPPAVQMQVYTPSKKYSEGIHTATWIVDPDHEYNDPNLANNQVSFQFTVSSPAPAFDFSISISPMTQTIKAGQETSFSINVQLTSGSPANVDLALSGLPSGTSHQFSTSSGSPSYASTLSIQTSDTTPTGSYSLTLTGEGDSITKTLTIQLIVESALEQDFTLSISQGSQSITAGQSIDYIITLEPVNEFNDPVIIVVSGLPPDSTKTVNPTQDTPPFTSLLEIKTTDSTPAGEYSITIIASGGGKTHEETVQLEIEQKPLTSTIETPTPTTTATTGFAPESYISRLTQDPYLLLIILLIIIIIVLAAVMLKRR